MNTHTQRSISALFFVLIYFSALFSGIYFFAAFLVLVALVAVFEWLSIAHKIFKSPNNSFTKYFLFASVLFTAWFKLIHFQHQLSVYIALAVLFSSIMLILNHQQWFNETQKYLVSWWLIILPLFFMLEIVQAKQIVGYTYQPMLILLPVVLIWANDTFAYLTGRKLGKRPFFPSISPKKTIEGTLGGTIVTVALAPLFIMVFPQFYIWQMVILALVVSLASTLGDLVESKLKRLAGVKDSGNIMPGHGGILDRFDSHFFVMPLVYCLYLWWGII
jgi:phosphatidate cytidylyltransferase